MFRFLKRWLICRKYRRNKARTLGNAGMTAYETPSSAFEKHGTFERAHFGKYETPFLRLLWVRITLLFITLILSGWLLWECFMNFNIFS